jgi:hypothetical protein
MNDDEFVRVWEVDDGIYDLDGDLLIWTLMGIGVICLQEALFISNDFTKSIIIAFAESSDL